MTDLYTPSDHHVRQYSQNVTLLAQQEGSILAGTVRTDGNRKGNRCAFDAYGKGSMQVRASRYADTYLADTARQRRWANIVDYERGELVDEEDQLKTIHDPQNPLAMVGANAAGVQKDICIYNALGGSATEGNGDGQAFATAALPAGQKVVVGGTSLTYAKVLDAVKLLKASGAWFMRMNGMNQAYGVINANQEHHLLNEIEAKSVDHYGRAHSVIEEGTLNGKRWMGVTWMVVPDGITSVDGSASELMYVYLKGGLGLAQNRDISTDFSRRADKSNAMQVLVKWHGGCVRIDDKAVVEIACAA